MTIQEYLKETEREFDERWKKKDYFDFSQEAIKSFLTSRQEGLLKVVGEMLKGQNDLIPCDCPKGGLIGENESPCDKCGGSEWIKKHICPFNDGKRNCKCYSEALSQAQEVLKIRK